MGTPGKPQSQAWPHAFVFSTLSPLCPTALMVALAQGGLASRTLQLSLHRWPGARTGLQGAG